jgi:acetyl esterase
VFGDLDAYDPQCRNLALASGVAILCVDYRRAPEHPFPAAVADAQAATCWALDTAAALGVDPGRIGLCGDSAGGALSLVTALALPGRLRAVLALYPVTDMRELGLYDSARRFGKGFFLDLRLMQRFTDLYLPDPALALDPRVSVLLAEGLHRLPPNLIVTAGADPLRDQGEAFARRAAAAGAPVAIRCEAAMIHNFMGHGAVSAGAAAAFGRVAADLRRLLA